MQRHREPLYEETFTRIGRRLRARKTRRALFVGIAVLAPLLALALGQGLAALTGAGDGATPTAVPSVVAAVASRERVRPGQQVAEPPTGTEAAPETPAATSTPTTTLGAPPSAPVPGRVFVVAGTDGQGVLLRRAPGGDPVDVYREGTRLQQLGPDQEVQGVTWRHVRAADGAEGWVAAQYTAPAP